MTATNLPSAARAALFRFGCHGTPEHETAAAAVWATHSPTLLAMFRHRPTVSTARAVATFAERGPLASFAADWIAWHDCQPDPRGLLEHDSAADTSRALDAWQAEEPTPPTTRRKARA